jgi:ribonuclease M5
MYQIKESIIVEGVYDKIKLSRFIDGIIFPTNGFRVFTDADILKTIKLLADKTGIVIFTDSDSAGFKIRNYIKQSLPENKVKHAYIPDVKGKERRKTMTGKEGLLGVEGMGEDVILNALRQAGCSINGTETMPRMLHKITKSDLYAAGLSGDVNSATYRRELAKCMGIPSKISANMLLDCLNRMLNYDEFVQLVQSIKAGL